MRLYRNIVLKLLKKFPGISGHTLADSYAYEVDKIDRPYPPLYLLLEELIVLEIVEQEFTYFDQELRMPIYTYSIKDMELADMILSLPIEIKHTGNELVQIKLRSGIKIEACLN